MSRPFHLSASAAALMVFLAACGGVPTVNAAELQTQASEQFSAQFPVDAIDCPDDLTAEVGETVECTLTSEGTTFVMEATVDSVDGDNAALSFELTEEL